MTRERDSGSWSAWAREAMSRHARMLVSGMRVGRFISVGLIGTVCDNAVLGALYAAVGAPLWASKVVGAEVAIVVMFVLNERWTFADAGRAGLGPTLLRFLRSNLVRIGGIVVATGVLLALYHWLGFWWLLANLIGIAAGFVVNYTFESLYTWRVQRA